MSLFESLKARSSSALDEGKWVQVPDVPGWEIRVRPWSAYAAQELQADLLDALSDEIRAKPRLPYRVAKDIETKVILGVCLVDWRGVDEAYSQEAAEKILTDPELRWGRRAIVRAIEDVEEEAAKARETDLGNSSSASAGS